MTCVALLQARTSSVRLPAKVLLPLRGIPLAVLAAQRAGNTGLPVIVATSSTSSDDELQELCTVHGLEVFRGSLTDTLGRMTAALDGRPGDTLVVRLTADNPLPDGALLDALAAEFVRTGVEYLVCGGPGSGLPHGVSAELFRLETLRAADDAATAAADREHVTPWIRRRCGVTVSALHRERGLEDLRCTIDCRDDYELLARVMRAVDDPMTAPLDELLAALEACWPYPRLADGAGRRLVLGTAQLGMPYGIANRGGMPAAPAAAGIVKTAIACGVQWLDTARAYGSSEQVIGACFADGWRGRAGVITKLNLPAELPDDAPAAQVAASVDASIYASAAALGSAALDVVLLHRATHLTAWRGAALQRLNELAAAGVVGQLGVSVQSPAELAQALEIPQLRFVQLPFNLLDGRWAPQVDALRAARRTRELTVHARSTLLQGLLLSNDPRHWATAHCADGQSVRAWLKAQSGALTGGDIAALALRYALSMDWIDAAVVGVETTDQLEHNLRQCAEPPLTAAQVADLETARPRVPTATLDPAQWKTG